MASTSDLSTAASADQIRPAASYHTNLVTALLATWFTVGLMLDAWAHNNVPELETFFTPWHAVFYSGFAATAVWIAWVARGALRPGGSRAAIPVGYGAAIVAVGGFGVAAIGDLSWHTIFGIEQRIDILFSPTHLGLGATMFVILVTPLRSAWADRSLPAAPGLRRLLPAVLSTAMATTLVLLFLLYANVLSFSSGDVVVALSNLEEDFTANLVGHMALTNVILLVPLLTLARRWRLPFGAATIVYAAAGTLSLAIAGFHNRDMMVGLLVAGICVDLIARWLRPSQGEPIRYRAFAGVAPLVTWTIYIATAYLTSPRLYDLGIPFERPEPIVEVYTGAPVVQALIGLLIGVLLIPSAAGSFKVDRLPERASVDPDD